MRDEATTRLLTALADPTRRRALALLWQGREFCVCELMERLCVTQSRMSRHMSVLKATGLVVDRRVAQWVRYRRNPRLPDQVERITDAVVGATSAPSRRRSSASSSYIGVVR